MSNERVILIKAEIFKCANCGASAGRYPLWRNGDMGCHNSCDKCEGTSFVSRDARPFGRRSKEWDYLIGELTEMLELYPDANDLARKNVLDSVVMEEV